MTDTFDLPATVFNGLTSRSLGAFALMLDFDGTLVEIAPTPSSITVPPILETILNELIKRGTSIALISGRSVKDVQSFLPDFKGPISGGHGAEFWDGTSIKPTSDVPAATILGAIELAKDFAADHPGVEAEEKPTGVVLHYRNAMSFEAAANAAMEQICRDRPDLEIHRAKAAVEARPTGVSKGDAVRGVMAAQTDTVPFAIGDDVTDEDMFEVVRNAGGIAIKVGSGPTQADYRLRGPDDVLQLLMMLHDRKDET